MNASFKFIAKHDTCQKWYLRFHARISKVISLLSSSQQVPDGHISHDRRKCASEKFRLHVYDSRDSVLGHCHPTVRLHATNLFSFSETRVSNSSNSLSWIRISLSLNSVFRERIWNLNPARGVCLTSTNRQGVTALLSNRWSRCRRLDSYTAWRNAV